MASPYIKRTIEATIAKASEAFPVLLITGPRQIGKTTCLENFAGGGRNYVSLDDLGEMNLANSDPELFLKTHPTPLIIDEVQYAPNLFRYIKIICDRLRRPGLFWLTGSQKFNLMQNVTESLAGRVAIIDLLGFSRAEIYGYDNNEFLPTEDWLEKAISRNPADIDIKTIYLDIWNGSFPQLVLDKKTDRNLFYSSYIRTYIQRDVRDIAGLSDEISFYRFIQVVASRTAQLVNFADIAKDADIDQRTAKKWLHILEASGLVYMLYPYHQNTSKRLVKTPKLYFLDTGLCSYLTRWNSAEALASGAMSGAILETYIITELLKSYWHNGKEAFFYFYRNSDQKEIDLLIEQDNILYPIEIKRSANPSLNSIKNFSSLEKLERQIGLGAVICLKDNYIPISKKINAIPIKYL